jgi:hypothetical protein
MVGFGAPGDASLTGRLAFLTFFAKPEKVDPVPGDFERALFLDFFIQFLVAGHLKILHAAASFANEMTMGP